MTFINQLKAYEILCGCLTMQAQMIYYKLFKHSNRYGLGLPFYISNEDLMQDAMIKNKQTFINARNLLIQQGFILFQSGKKNMPSVYQLVDLEEKIKGYYTHQKLDPNEFSEEKNSGTNSTGNRTESVPEIRPNLDGNCTEFRRKVGHNKAIAIDNAKAKTKATASKRAREDVNYAEAVKMTQEEYGWLVDKVGSEDGAKWCVEKLNNYKLSSGKKYKSDYRAILNWVVGEYQSRQPSREPQGSVYDEIMKGAMEMVSGE